jgi:hypothetical protein
VKATAPKDKRKRRTSQPDDRRSSLTSLLEYTLGISSEDGVTIVSKVIQDMIEWSVIEDQHVKKPDFAEAYMFTVYSAQISCSE